jgi:hypothetical protein
MSNGKSSNKVFVTVELFQGNLEEVRAFKSCKSADEAQQKWLAGHDISDEISRECKAANGTEFHIFECPIEG